MDLVAKICGMCGQGLADGAVYCDKCGHKQLGVENAHTSDRAGQMFGSYRLTQLIGSGAMGDVYVGEHTSVGRRVAIKVLKKELATNPQVVARFFSEARVVNEIQHPCIVQSIDFLTEPDNAVVMELLEGESLRALLAQGPMSEARAVRLAKQIADGMAAVHAAQVVHRDLKPDNVFVLRGDAVKILDFGVAKLRKGSANNNVSTMSSGFLGTLAYMAPEQVADSKAVDYRADIYSFGVMLYEMVSGSRPFEAESFGEMVIKHVTVKPKPPDNASPAIRDLVMACLAKDPEKRPAAMSDISERLLAYSPVDRPKRRSLRLIAPVLVLAIVGVVALAARMSNVSPSVAGPSSVAPSDVAPRAVAPAIVAPTSVDAGVAPPTAEKVEPQVAQSSSAPVARSPQVVMPAKKQKKAKRDNGAGKDDVVNPFED